MHEKKTAVALLSGGIDSTVLLHSLRPRYGQLLALSFLYGQRHDREIACARYQADLAGASYHLVDMAFLGELLQGESALLRAGASVPDLADIPERFRDQPPTYVPNRNMILLSLAAAFAEARGVQDVFYGAQAQDEYGYWDCTPQFLERINTLLALNRRDAVRIHAPLMNCSKADNVRIGLSLGVDFARTWSCYRGGDKPCGACPTCVERSNAFSEVGIADPLCSCEGAGS